MFDILQMNPWLASGVILITQISFIFFRTINVIHTAEKNWIKSVLSGFGVSVCWLMSVSLGVTSMLNGQWQPIVAFIISGAIGTFIGIKVSKWKKPTSSKFDSKIIQK
jgi:uncharacterized protein YebE (UPF0316 family)